MPKTHDMPRSTIALPAMISRGASHKRPFPKESDEGQEYYYNQYSEKLTSSIDNTNDKMINLTTTTTTSNTNYQSEPINNWPSKRRRSGTNSTTFTYLKQDRHLVQTVSDLPEFVTIEYYRVASYNIGGEPYICLPQLLQFLKEKFTLKRLVEKFEESMINFTSASAKQVDGFIKACVLPNSAKSCSLIKRSDADKVCLSLYEQCYKRNTNDIVELSSMHQRNANNKTNFILNSITCSGSSSSGSGSGSFSANACSGCKSDIDSISALAKAVTSTLMIQVYHRCFGKSVGLYYPSLLLSSRSACIECSRCKIMLSPRRFVGHTHGQKEHDVCHWGFNSYNWRYYINLSSRQTMNNLSQDELLNQFKTLQSAAQYIDTENIKQSHYDVDYEFDQTDSSSSNLIENINEKTTIHMTQQSTSNHYQHNLVERNNKLTAIRSAAGISTSKALPFHPLFTYSSGSTPYYSTPYYPINSVNLETRRETYICSNLNSYLKSKGLEQSCINDIVVNTLNLIHESKSIT